MNHITATAGGVSMTSGDYLDKILKRMTCTHNITRNYVAYGRTFAAYALYESFGEKYVLTRKANLWKISESEHILFLALPEDGDPGALFAEAKHLIADFMEPVMARSNEKYPPKDHMRTFLTVVLLMEHSPDQDLIRCIRRFRFEKSYLFSLRGFSQGRIVAVDIPRKSVYTSPAAKDVAGFYRQVL